MPSTSAQQAFDRTMGGLRDPWTRLARLRREDGVIEGDAVPDAGAGTDSRGRRFAVLRYDDCARVLRDNVTFSSRVYERVMGPVMGHTILEMDEPEHGRFRKLAGQAFRHKALQRWESELIGPLAEETIAAFAGRGHAELVRELTFPFPVQVIARILGLPHRDYPMFQELAFTLTSVGAGYRASRQASDQLGAYLLPIVRDRRARPADDLISELAIAEIDGQALTDDEIVSYLRLLLPAGSETTYCSIGNLLFALLTHTGQLDDVRDDRALVHTRDRGTAPVGAGHTLHPPSGHPRRHHRRRRHPGGRPRDPVPRLGEPRRAPIQRARSLRHTPARAAATGLRLRASHVPGDAPGPHGDAGRARGGARPAVGHRAGTRSRGIGHGRSSHPRHGISKAELPTGQIRYLLVGTPGP